MQTTINIAKSVIEKYTIVINAISNNMHIKNQFYKDFERLSGKVGIDDFDIFLKYIMFYNQCNVIQFFDPTASLFNETFNANVSEEEFNRTYNAFKLL